MVKAMLRGNVKNSVNSVRELFSLYREYAIERAKLQIKLQINLISNFSNVDWFRGNFGLFLFSR